MPREEYTIGNFEGGVVTEVADKDLAENSCSDIRNLRVDKIGRLVVGPNAQIREEFSTSDVVGFTNDSDNLRESLYSFSADRLIQESVKVTTIATAESGAAISLTTATTHSFAPGDVLTLIGTYNAAYDTTALVKTVSSDMLGLTLDFAFGSGQSGQTAYLIKNSEYRDHQHRFLAMANKNKVSIYDNLSLTPDAIVLQDSFGAALGASAGNSDTTNVKPSYFAVDGTLRVCDGNFSNLNNNHTRWYGYIPPRPIGSYEDLRGSDETGFAAFTENASNLSENNGAGSLVQGMDFKSTETGGSGANYIATGDATATLTETRKIHVTFDLIHISGEYPIIYLASGNTVLPGGNSSSSASANNIDSEFKLAKNGLNHFELTKINGNNASYLIFYTTGNHEFQVKNLRITGNGDGVSIGGFEGGYYDLPATLFEPGREEIQTLDTHNGGLFTTIGYVDTNSGNYTGTTIAVDPDGHIGAPYMSVLQNNKKGDWYFVTEHKYLQFGMTWIYDGNQESRMNPNTAKIINEDDNEHVMVVNSAGSDEKCLDMEIGFASWPKNPRITGARIYIIGYGETSTQASKVLEDPLLLATVNAVSSAREYTRGNVVWCDGSTTSIEANGVTGWKASGVIHDFPSLTYKILNGYDPYDTIDARWECSVVANRRLYVGNVRHKAASDRDLVVGSSQSSEELQNYPDRMLRSPVNKFDTLPSRSEITVAGNDGESIVALRTFKGKLLQFKEETVYIINISEDYEYLEDKLSGVGVPHRDATVETEFGIAWVSRQGVHLYDGQNVVNLIQAKISTEDWLDYIGWSGGTIGYIPIDAALVVFSRSESQLVYIYSFKTKSWVISENALPAPNFKLAAPVNWHWSAGLSFLSQQQSTNGEVFISEESTVGIEGVKAVGSIKFSGGSFQSGQKLYIKDSSNTARQVSHMMFGAMTGGDLTNQEVASALFQMINAQAADSGYKLNATSTMEVDGDGLVAVDITASATGVAYNASGSASAAELRGLYFDTDGTSPVLADSDGDLTDSDFTPLSGGVDTVPSVYKIHVNRQGSTKTGVTYQVGLQFKQNGSFISGNTPVKVFAHTSTSSQGAEDVVDSLISEINTNAPEYLEYMTIAKGGSSSDWFLQITSNWIDSTSTTTQQGSGCYEVTPFYTWVIEDSVNMYDFRLDLKSDFNGNILYVSKDIDFGAPARRKKIYKIYVTYKADSNTTIHPYYVADGKEHNSSSYRKAFAYNSKYTESNGLTTTSGAWVTLELTPASSSDANNIKSFKLILASTGRKVPKSFEVNDISVIYRKKSVK